MSRNTPYTIEEIKTFLIKNGLKIELLSTNYTTNKDILDFKCNVCEHFFKRNWNEVSSKLKHCPVCGKNGTRITLNEIRELVNSYNYKVIEFVGGDSNKGTLFKVECDRGHSYNTSYREFLREETKRGGSCKQCVKDGFNKTRKKIIKEYHDFIKENKYTYIGELLTVINDTRTFLCENGHVRTMKFSSFLDQPSCPECRGHKRKLTENDIIEKLEELGLIYLSGYDNNIPSQSTIRFICSCGNEDCMHYQSILKNPKCEKCRNRIKWNFKRVTEFYSDNGCSLLEAEYLNNKTDMAFKCKCGNIDCKSFNEFMYYPICRKCIVSTIPKGERHHAWNPNKTDEDRRSDRKYKEYSDWRNSVFKRDSYTCQCCGDNKGGNIEAHHIFNYSEHKELRTDVNNGITFCADCHKDFHLTYGYKNNNDQQIIEFLNKNKIKNLKTS